MFLATVLDVLSNKVAKLKLPNTIMTAELEVELQKGDSLYLQVKTVSPLVLKPHSVRKIQLPKSTDLNIDYIIRVFGLSKDQVLVSIIENLLKISSRVVRENLIKMQKVILQSELASDDIKKSVYVMGMLADNRLEITAKSFETVLPLFDQNSKVLDSCIYVLHELDEVGILDIRGFTNQEAIVTTSFQYLMDYHSPNGLYKTIIKSGLTEGKHFKKVLTYFDGLLYWNSLSSIAKSPLITPLIVKSTESKYGIHLIHLWLSLSGDRASFLFDDLFKLKSELDGKNFKIEYSDNKLKLDIDFVNSLLKDKGYNLTAYNLESDMIYLERDKKLNTLSGGTTFVI
ncbi:MAG: hypothetical protein Kapaf2KO_09700 [Candidatus Kapaibacteriales bacterium]